MCIWVNKSLNPTFYCKDPSRSSDLWHISPLLRSEDMQLSFTCIIQNGVNLQNSEQKKVMGCGI